MQNFWAEAAFIKHGFKKIESYHRIFAKSFTWAKYYVLKMQ